MDVKLANLLSKDAIMAIAHKIINIIEETIRPLADTKVSGSQIDTIIETIGSQLVKTIAEQENKEKK
mgnify:CR=1 FL=1